MDAHTLDERIRMFLNSFLQAAIAGPIIMYAFLRRTAIGRSASNIAGAAGIAMAVNGVLLVPGNGFLDDRARVWAEQGQTVPVAWGFAQSALPMFSSVLQIVAVGLLALAVFLPRHGTGTRPEASDL